jgi:hypothetical protein
MSNSKQRLETCDSENIFTQISNSQKQRELYLIGAKTCWGEVYESEFDRE